MKSISELRQLTKGYALMGAVYGFIGAILFAGLIIFIGVSQQLMAWLKEGVWVERDLLWALADVRCEETGWKSKGFEGMVICREDYVTWVDWVGVNKIINWFLDLHISISLGAIIVVALYIFYEVTEEYQ